MRGGVRIETWVAKMGMNAEDQWGRSWESVEGTGGATAVTGISALVLGVRGIMRCCRASVRVMGGWLQSSVGTMKSHGVPQSCWEVTG